MLKKILSVLFCICLFLHPIYAQEYSSQEKLKLTLTPNGLFKDNQGNDYAVILFEGKNRTELYDMVIKHVNSLYRSPKEVMSVIENEMISIYALSDKLAYDNILGITRRGVTYYTIKIHFKDNKIKIDFPSISKVTFGSGSQEMTISYSYQVGTYFEKKTGKPKKKRIEWIESIEKHASWVCNYLIWGSEKEQKSNEEW